MCGLVQWDIERSFGGTCQDAFVPRANGIINQGTRSPEQPTGREKESTASLLVEGA